MLYDSILETLEKTNLIYSYRKHFSGPGIGWGGELTSEERRGNFWGDGTVHYLDCGSGYMGVYIVQNSSECTFNMSIIH